MFENKHLTTYFYFIWRQDVFFTKQNENFMKIFPYFQKDFKGLQVHWCLDGVDDLDNWKKKIGKKNRKQLGVGRAGGREAGQWQNWHDEEIVKKIYHLFPL